MRRVFCRTNLSEIADRLQCGAPQKIDVLIFVNAIAPKKRRCTESPRFLLT